MERGQSIDFLPDRLNREPVIYKGLTNSELFSLVKIGALVWFPLSLFLFWLFGKTILGLGAGMALTFGTVVIGALYLQKKKRGKPDGWYDRHLKIQFQDRGLTSYGFTRYTGRWDIRRKQRDK